MIVCSPSCVSPEWPILAWVSGGQYRLIIDYIGEELEQGYYLLSSKAKLGDSGPKVYLL